MSKIETYMEGLVILTNVLNRGTHEETRRIASSITTETSVLSTTEKRNRKRKNKQSKLSRKKNRK